MYTPQGGTAVPTLDVNAGNYLPADSELGLPIPIHPLVGTHLDSRYRSLITF